MAMLNNQMVGWDIDPPQRKTKKGHPMAVPSYSRWRSIRVHCSQEEVHHLNPRPEAFLKGVSFFSHGET